MEWAAVVSSGLGIVALLLKAYFAGKPQRDERKADEELQQGRKDVVDGNVDAVSARIDRLLKADQGNGTAGSKDGKGKDGTTGPV